MGSTLVGVVKHMACRSDLTWAFPSWRCSINLRDLLLLTDGLSLGRGLSVGQTAEGYVFGGHEVSECRGLEDVTSQEFIFSVSLLEENLIQLVVLQIGFFFSFFHSGHLKFLQKYFALGVNGSSESP